MVGQAQQRQEDMTTIPLDSGYYYYGGGHVVVGGAVTPLPLSMEPSHPRPASSFPFCSLGCVASVTGATMIYAGLMTMAGLVAFYVAPPALGLTLLALLPAVFLLSYLQRLYRKSVMRRQMMATFFQALIYMLPIVALELLYGTLLMRAGVADPTEATNKEAPAQHMITLSTIGSAFLQAFTVAGFFEELVKYLAIRRIFNKDFVVDPRALLVYAACAGAAFGTFEDLEYVLGAGREGKGIGIITGVFRGFVAVPLHTGTAILMGASLAHTRFILGDTTQERWYKTIVIPVLVHGSYDFLVMAFGEPGLYVAFLIILGLYAYIRHRLIRLQRAHPEEVNVQAEIDKGKVVPMSNLSLAYTIIASLSSLVAMLFVQAAMAAVLAPTSHKQA